MMLRPMFLFQYLSEVWFSDLNFFSLYVTFNLLYLDICVNDMSLKWKALVEVSPLYSFLISSSSWIQPLIPESDPVYPLNSSPVSC